MASEDNQQIELERLTEDNQTVAKWALDTFGKPNPLAVLRRLCDEVLEAMEICVTDNLATRTMFGAMRQGLENLDKYRLPDQELEKRRETIALELADAQIVAYHAEGVLGVDLPALVNRKMVINRNRRWKINADNTGQHIEETEE